MGRLLLVLFTVAICGCAAASPPAESAVDDRTSYEARAATFSAAVERASASGWAAPQLDSLADFYSERAVVFPGDNPPLRGRSAIRADWGRSERRILRHEVTTELVEMEGQVAVDHGRTTVTVQRDTTAPETHVITFISTWRRGTDGVWRKQMDSFW